MQVVEDQLSQAHYLLGDNFTAVDVVCGQVLTLAEVSCTDSPYQSMYPCCRVIKDLLTSTYVDSQS